MGDLAETIALGCPTRGHDSPPGSAGCGRSTSRDRRKAAILDAWNWHRERLVFNKLLRGAFARHQPQADDPGAGAATGRDEAEAHR